jgi:hypothetical protein
MAKPQKRLRPEQTGQVIDFDEGLIKACPPHVRDELRSEADILTGAFAGEEDPTALRRMARSLVRTGSVESFEQRLHARRLAALLRLRAKASEAQD